jgi:hypothetical protein
MTYVRSTTFKFTHTYQKNGVNSSDGISLLFTVKPTEFDSDASDSTAILTKTVAMTGATTVVTIDPTDIADTVAPGDYFFSIHIKESNGPPAVIYPGISGTFKLVGDSTNREA